MSTKNSHPGTFFLQPEGFRLPGIVQMPKGVTPQVLGQLVEDPARQLVAQYYQFPLGSKPASATGPDIIVPVAHRLRVEFDVADIKPMNVAGVRKFWSQLDSWRDFGWAGHPPFKGKAAMFGYDAVGHLYLYGIYTM